MTSGLVNASFGLPEWQAVKMIFFAPCLITKYKSIDFGARHDGWMQALYRPTIKDNLLEQETLKTV